MRRLGVLALAVLLVAVTACGEIQAAPMCEGGEDVMVLMAQSVPSAELVPCLQEELPKSWFLNTPQISSAGVRLQFGSDMYSSGASIVVNLLADCDPGTAVEVPSDEEGARRFEDIDQVDAGYRGTRYYVFDGGCATYQFDLPAEGWSGVVNDVTLILGFTPRRGLEGHVQERTRGVVQGL
jgi:hypothetical protein